MSIQSLCTPLGTNTRSCTPYPHIHLPASSLIFMPIYCRAWTPTSMYTLRSMPVHIHSHYCTFHAHTATPVCTVLWANPDSVHRRCTTSRCLSHPPTHACIPVSVTPNPPCSSLCTHAPVPIHSAGDRAWKKKVPCRDFSQTLPAASAALPVAITHVQTVETLL